MKNSKSRRLLAFVLVVAVILGVFAFSAMAQDGDPNVTYNGTAKAFEFTNVTKYTDASGERTYPDLFGDTLKGLMPGDSVEKTITVKVINSGSNTVKISLKAENGNADYTALMEAATLKVSDGTTEITGSLASGVLLGSFAKDQSRDVTVEFSIPVEAGNEIADLTAEIDWVFTAEVITSGGSSSGPVTPPRPELEKDDHYAYVIGYDDGLVHPEAQITRAEVATIFFRMLTDESRNQYWMQLNDYDDVSSSDWYNTAVSTLSNAGILTGYPNGSFGPNDPITRAEFATIATRFFDAEYSGADLFDDISGHWAADYINKAANAGLVNGYGDGTFLPQNDITRSEAIAIFNRVLSRCPDKDHLLDDMITWPDNMDTSKWYYADVQEATNSHEYEKIAATASTKEYENWTAIKAVRDWAALEKAWADSNDSTNPGEVISSATATK